MEISGKTRLLGLIGTPVEHSGSPAMYNYCFKREDIDYRYLAFDIQMDKTAEAVESLRLLNMRGANVTMPLKSEASKYVDKLSPAASIIGVINTITNDDGVLTGHITDGVGYVSHLNEIGVDVRGGHIVILGGGGAATAILTQCALDGAAEVSVFNIKDSFYERIEENLKNINAKVPECKITLGDLGDTEALRAAIANADILTNATRVGMAPMDDQSLITDLSMLRPELVVTDVVYLPTETKLMRDARAIGCKVARGLDMLIWQGAAAYKLYTGLDMPVDEVRVTCFGG